MASEKWLDKDRVEVTEKVTNKVVYSVSDLEQKLEQKNHILSVKRALILQLEAEVQEILDLLYQLKNHDKRPE